MLNTRSMAQIYSLSLLIKLSTIEEAVDILLSQYNKSVLYSIQNKPKQVQ